MKTMESGEFLVEFITSDNTKELQEKTNEFVESMPGAEIYDIKFAQSGEKAYLRISAMIVYQK